MVQVLNDQNFEATVSAHSVVLVDFFADWCGPCKMLAPILEQLSAKLPNVFIGKVNIDQSSELASRFHVTSIPTLVVLKNGQEVDRSMGLKDENAIIQMVQKHL